MLLPNHPIRIFNICLLLIFSTPQIQGTRLSPKQNISLPQQINSNFSSQQKLRKLPHVFNNVLELPFRYDTDVTVEEKEGFFRFVAKSELIGAGNYGHVRAQAVEIHPGITKIVVTNGDNEIKLLLEELYVDTWRYRLPASTIPELATAVVVDGELIVTVPKSRRGRGEFDGGYKGVWGGGGRLVLVQ